MADFMPNDDYYDRMLPFYLQEAKKRDLEALEAQLKRTEKNAKDLAYLRSINAKEPRSINTEETSWKIYLRRANAAENRMIDEMDKEELERSRENSPQKAFWPFEQGTNEDEMAGDELEEGYAMPLSEEMQEAIDRAKQEMMSMDQRLPQEAPVNDISEREDFIQRTVEKPSYYQDVLPDLVPNLQYYELVLGLTCARHERILILKAKTIKYLLRAGKKESNTLEVELRKARWYMQKIEELLQKSYSFFDDELCNRDPAEVTLHLKGNAVPAAKVAEHLVARFPYRQGVLLFRVYLGVFNTFEADRSDTHIKEALIAIDKLIEMVENDS
jgi:hypothetical protein